VRLFDFLDRSEALEVRAAALYRAFAAARRDDPELAALWTALAADEDAHARSVREARSRLDSLDGALTAVGGCEAALIDIAQRLRRAEELGPDITTDRQLAVALELELSELEPLRRVGLEASHSFPVPQTEEVHVRRLAHTALRRSHDDHVRLAAALLLVRWRLTASPARQSGGETTLS
jgi:hypothetical protein